MYWVVDLFQIPCLGLCPLSTNWKILLISLTKYAISGQSDMEADLLPEDLVCLNPVLKLLIFVFQKSMQILSTDRALPTIRCMNQIRGWGVGGGSNHRHFIDQDLW